MSAERYRVTLHMKYGGTTLQPVSGELLELLESVSVTESDGTMTSFVLSFKVGWDREKGNDFQWVISDVFRPLGRIVLAVFINGTPTVLVDGLINSFSHQPDMKQGGTTLTVQGGDLSIILDNTKRDTASSRCLTGDLDSVLQELLSGEHLLQQYGVEVKIADFSTSHTPNSKYNMQSTLRQDLEQLALHMAFEYRLTPGDEIGKSLLYIGPRESLDLTLPPITLNAGPESNATPGQFSYSGTTAYQAISASQISVDGTQPGQLQTPQHVGLAANPANNVQGGVLGRTVTALPGENNAQTKARLNREYAETVTGSCTVDTFRYGRVIRCRAKVDIRGAGHAWDGTYRVSSVTHTLGKGHYQQSVGLAREGLGPIKPRVLR